MKTERIERNKIAVLTAELSDAYQGAIWKGIAAEAARRERGLVCFLGSRVDSPIRQEAASNTVYDLANAENFDGLIIISSAISTYLDADQVQYLFDAHPGIPKISIGIRVNGAGSITVDGSRVMTDLVEHLIERHGRTCFAVIAGPKWHAESEQRLHAAVRCLRAHGLEWDHGLLIHGSFEQDSGSAAMGELLNRGRPIDAVLCLNDRMAFGALEELHRRGIAVPDRVSLVGFDGIEETAYCTPPLTTVLQPLYELGCQAVRELYRLLEGSGSRDLTLNCSPVYRESCGCGPVLAPRVSSCRGTTFQGGRGEQEADLFELARTGRYSEFLHRFNAVLTGALLRREPLEPWPDFLADLRAYFAENVGLSGGRALLDLVTVFDAANTLLGEMKIRVQGAQRIERMRRNDVLRWVCISLAEVFEIPVLIDRLTEGMQRIGVRSAYLVLYEDDDAANGRSRLLLSLRQGRSAVKRNAIFPRSLVLAPGTPDFRETRIWMLTPLVFQDRAIGHLVLPGDLADTEVYETLSTQVASSLQGALLMEQVRGHEQSLEREVKRRTEQMTITNRTLRREIQTRIRLEKEVAEISRRTMERIGRDLHDDLCQHLAGVAMHVTALESRLDGEGSRVAVERINELVKDSIERAKAIVRGLLPPGLEEEGILTALRVLVDAVRRGSDVPVSFEEDRAFLALEQERAVELFRIIQEALNNSVKHSGCSQIAVRLYTGSGDGARILVAEVSDDGSGFDPDAASEGMGLKIMRYRAEKARAALHISGAPRGTLVRCTLSMPKRKSG